MWHPTQHSTKTQSQQRWLVRYSYGYSSNEWNEKGTGYLFLRRDSYFAYHTVPCLEFHAAKLADMPIMC